MKENLLVLLDNSRNYTLAVAGAMPSNQYNYKPAKDGFEFGEQIHHIGYGIQWWEENYLKGIKTDWNPPPIPDSKESIIDYVNKAYDRLNDTVKKSKGDEATIRGFYATLDHITHHRGQAVVYLRCKGIAAPEYSY